MRILRAIVLLLGTASLALCQNGDPRDLAAYPARAEVGGVTLAAEYLVHSLPTASGSLFAEKYLVVEAAFFGKPYSQLKVSASHFSLRINGKKTVILPQTPAWVAASIKDPAWYNQSPQTTVAGGVGNVGVLLGAPRPVERFPGDPSARRPVPPGTPPRVEKQPEAPIEDQIQEAALAEGERRVPVHGLLFFAFTGSTKSIKSVELLYEGPAGMVAIKLQ